MTVMMTTKHRFFILTSLIILSLLLAQSWHPKHGVNNDDSILIEEPLSVIRTSPARSIFEILRPRLTLPSILLKGELLTINLQAEGVTDQAEDWNVRLTNGFIIQT